MTIESVIIVMLLAFVCEFIDSSLGMGFGTILTPSLMLLGFLPLALVPAVLFSELFSGILAGTLHHKAKNVNMFSKESMKTTIILFACGIVGSIIAVLVHINIPKSYAKSYIGIMLLVMAILIIYGYIRNTEWKFSYKKIMGLGLIAAFNKGISGGGYGPVVMGGQVLSGVNGKSAIGITSFSEGVVCLFGFLTYLFFGGSIHWDIVASITTGGLLSVPFSVFVVKKIPEKKVKLLVAISMFILGLSVIVLRAGG